VQRHSLRPPALFLYLLAVRSQGWFSAGRWLDSTQQRRRVRLSAITITSCPWGQPFPYPTRFGRTRAL